MSQAEATQVAGVAHQGVAAQPVGEQGLGLAAGLILVHGVETEAAPGRLGAFHDEGRGARFELVGVGPDPAVRGVDEGEGEGVERLFRTQPDIFVGPHVDVDAEHLGIVVAHPAVSAPSAATMMSASSARMSATSLWKRRSTPSDRAAFVQDRQQSLPADAREAVAAGADGLAVDMDVDVVPVDERRPRWSPQSRGRWPSDWPRSGRRRPRPQPKVSSGRLRSCTTTRRDGSRSFSEMAR
ncbi:MAG: hypothetical protein KL785_04955 [Brevundimonas sp.]|nr:hypothetical protein [Brevundimonas sp.]